MQWSYDCNVIKLNLGMAKNTKFYSGVNKTNTICRINHAYAFLKDSDVVVVVRMCAGDEMIFFFFFKCKDMRCTVT